MIFKKKIDFCLHLFMHVTCDNTHTEMKVTKTLFHVIVKKNLSDQKVPV